MDWWVYLILGVTALLILGLLCTLFKTVWTVVKFILIVIWLIITAPLQIVFLIIRRCKFLNYPLHIRKFHDNVTQGHPQIVYGETKKDYKVIGMTSAPKTDNIRNIPMTKNAEPGNKTPSYMHKRPKLISKKKRNSKKEGWKLSPPDYKTVGKIALKRPTRAKKHKKRRLARHR